MPGGHRMSSISSATIESLARRNYEAAMEASWEAATPEVRADWIEEATEQCQIVLDGIETDKTIEPLWEAMDCPDVTNDPFYNDFNEDAR